MKNEDEQFIDNLYHILPNLTQYQWKVLLVLIQDKVLSGQKEIVICSGIKLSDGRVLRCHRHGDGMLNAHHNGWKLAEGIEQQGFVTSKGRYVSRAEGRVLQDAAGIPSADRDGYRANTLFSEDLY